MNALHHGFRYLIGLALVFASNLCIAAQPPPRIQVWRAFPSSAASISGRSPLRNTRLRHTLIPPESSQIGSIIQVDTSTQGTSQTFTVTTTADTGAGSLRKAILDANENPGLDYINFNIGSGPQTITPGQFGMPEITSPVVINGTTQPGYSGTPIIELNGSNVWSFDFGLIIWAGNSTIRGLVISKFQTTAVVLTNLGNNVLENNFIGTNMDGTDSLPNWGNGVWIRESPNNRIGDTLPGTRNVISSNEFPNVAISGITSTGNRVVGNYIGTDRNGVTDLYNYYPQSIGVLIKAGAENNTVGGVRPGERNVISGNGFSNIYLEGFGTSFNRIQGNYLGTNALASAALYNGSGVIIADSASTNTIGDTTLEGRNIISGSAGEDPGIEIRRGATANVIQGNIIGAPASSALTFGNFDGVVIYQAPDNTIGGSTPGAGNIIDGNARHGVLIKGSLASGNQIQGNLIGAPFYPVGSGLLGNTGCGIVIDNAPGNVIGGQGTNFRNFISRNGQHGIMIIGDTASANVISGNLIGDDGSTVFGSTNYGNYGNGVLLAASGDTIGGSDTLSGNIIAFNKLAGVYDSAGNRNTIRSNFIFSNDSLGIDLGPHGITPNDTLDADNGANDLQNSPILDSASITPGAIRIYYHLDCVPGTMYTLDFFKNVKHDGSFFGEGETWIGTTNIFSGSGGRVDANVTILAAVRDSDFVTATATDQDGNTSEFSRALCMLDSDGDGILDMWESEGGGIDVNADGIIDLDLYAKGARPDHKDIFVEVDYMFGFTPADATLPLVQSAFSKIKNKYVNNPDHMDGINLWAEMSPDDLPIQDSTWTSNWWENFFAAKKQFFGTDRERTDPNAVNILDAKRLVYRYCIFAALHGVKGSSGIAENSGGAGGNDFMVTLGDFPGINDSGQAGTFMHELGHTLGLSHGGADDLNYKPNYYSVMNYTWQLPKNTAYYGGLGWTLNYSPVALPPLDEKSLKDSIGLNPAPGDFPGVLVPFNGIGDVKRTGLLYPGVAIDWDSNGDSSGHAVVTIDVNYLDEDPPNLPTPGEVLYGYADWPNLKYNFRSSPDYRDPTIAQLRKMAATVSSGPEEMTPQIYQHLQSLPPYGVVIPLNHWSFDSNINIPVSTASVSQNNPLAVNDGNGGAYFAWNHGTGTSSSSGIKAQRIDATGELQWLTNGIPVATGSEVQSIGDMVPTGDGNAIVAWAAARTGSFDIMAKKINRFGLDLWSHNGVSVTTVNGAPIYPWPRMSSDGRGGAILAWTDAHLGTRAVFVQRINASGDVQWAQGGVLINTSPYSSDDFQIISDGSNGAVIVWTDKRNGGVGDIYAQRVDSSGLVQWASNGVGVCTASGHQAAPTLASNGAGGAIVTWINYRAGGNDIYAQQVDSSGQTLWATNGIAVVSVTGQKTFGGIVPDGSHGAIISWLDGRWNGAPYAQRIDSAGVARWTANGVALTDTIAVACSESRVISDNHQGAIVVFVRSVFQSNIRHIFAQRIDSTGMPVWATNGVPVSMADGSAQSVSVAGDPSGGAIVLWESSRPDPLSGVRHIYAQNVTNRGVVGGGTINGVRKPPLAEIPSVFTLGQNYPNPFNPSTTISYQLPSRAHVTLQIFNVLGEKVRTLVDEDRPAGTYSVVANGTGLASGIYFYRITAGTYTRTMKMVLLR
jgi:hypothetical protein